MKRCYDGVLGWLSRTVVVNYPIITQNRKNFFSVYIGYFVMCFTNHRIKNRDIA
ncbi:hypothetical protein [Vagococcus salmoninarum]|uniref:hypothetical protein n=1 Tax=Vagococcus salmoninarum TaxID=2739 RepID=UPI003F9CDFEB